MNTQQGFVKMVILIIIGLIILGYFGFDIKKAIESPVARTNIEYAKDATVYVWKTYLKAPALYVYNEIFLKLIMHSIENNLRTASTTKP